MNFNPAVSRVGPPAGYIQMYLSVVLTGASSPWSDSHLVCRENPTFKCVPTNDPTLSVKG